MKRKKDAAFGGNPPLKAGNGQMKEDPSSPDVKKGKFILSNSPTHRATQPIKWSDPNDREGPQGSWLRPPARAIDPETEEFGMYLQKFRSPSNSPCLLVFQQMEVDYHIGDAVKGMPGNEEGPVPVIRFYGVTAEGNSVFLQAHGFMPYFYIRAPQGWDDSYCANFREALNVRRPPSPIYLCDLIFVSFRNAWLRRQEIRENSGVIIFWM